MIKMEGLEARAFLARDFARAIGFAKSSTTWHFCQVCSLICQVAQIANSKCKTVGYLFWSFWQITQMQTSNAKPLEMLLLLLQGVHCQKRICTPFCFSSCNLKNTPSNV